MFQEHWLLSDHLGALNLSDDFYPLVSAVWMIPSFFWGGCGILYRKSLAPFVSRLKCCSNHFCALSLTTCSLPNNCTSNTLLIKLMFICLRTTGPMILTMHFLIHSVSWMVSFPHILVIILSFVETLMLIFLGIVLMVIILKLLCIVTILLELILVLTYIILTEGMITLLSPGPITSSHCNIMCI